MPHEPEPPDVVAHKLATNQGHPARLHLEDATATIPIEPYRNGTPDTVTVPTESVTAVLERVHVEDSGLNLGSFNGIHLPKSEWERLGLHKHWQADDVDLHDPFTETHRTLELWGSREDAYYNTDPAEYTYDHLTPIPDESPLLTEWGAYGGDDAPDRPPVPFEYPSLYVYAIHAEDADYDSMGSDRVELGRVIAVDILLDDALDEWPKEPDIEKRDVDLSPPPRHPEITYDEIDPLPHDTSVLEAVRVINRYAKIEGEKADTAYERCEGAEARAHSLRKKALYSAKTVAVHRLVKHDPATVTLERHSLNEDHEMYCLYFPHSYAFHQPPNAVTDDLLTEVRSDDDEELTVTDIEFEASTDTSALTQSLNEALKHLADHGLNTNDYLDATTVEDYDWGCVIDTTLDAIPDPT